MNQEYFISVKERLPDPKKECKVICPEWDKSGSYAMLIQDTSEAEGNFIWCDTTIDDGGEDIDPYVTHWKYKIN